MVASPPENLLMALVFEAFSRSRCLQNDFKVSNPLKDAAIQRRYIVIPMKLRITAHLMHWSYLEAQPGQNWVAIPSAAIISKLCVGFRISPKKMKFPKTQYL